MGQVRYALARSSRERVLGNSGTQPPMSHEGDNIKKTTLGPKNWLHDQYMTIFCCKTSEKYKLYASSAFFGKLMKFFLVMTIDWCDLTYQKPLCASVGKREGS